MSMNTALAAGHVRRPLYQAIPLLVLSALLCSSCSVAGAHSWQCSAAEGTLSDHDIAVPETSTQFTGEMVIRKANGLSQWRPTARVVFTDRGSAEYACRCNGVVATWYPDNPDFFRVSLLVDGKETPLGSVPYDKPVTFKLTFTRDGELKLEVGTGVVTGVSSFPKRNDLHLSCSTADVDFHVTLAPPDPHSPERCPFAAQEQWPAADVDRYCKVRGQAG